jgi:hypothetical protein
MSNANEAEPTLRAWHFYLDDIPTLLVNLQALKETIGYQSHNND